MNSVIAQNVKLNFRTPDSPAPNEIRYAIGECKHGIFLVARDDSGICAIFIADRVEQLHQEIASAFPHSHLLEETTGWQREMEQVIAVIEGAPCELLEVSVRGTLFQQKVWQEICTIPYGTTQTYGQIAERLDMPNSSRAVAGACAANVLAFAIPCHRVIGSDGSISGYRWGSERKQEILSQEAHQ